MPRGQRAGARPGDRRPIPLLDLHMPGLRRLGLGPGYRDHAVGQRGVLSARTSPGSTTRNSKRPVRRVRCRMTPLRSRSLMSPEIAGSRSLISMSMSSLLTPGSRAATNVFDSLSMGRSDVRMPCEADRLALLSVLWQRECLFLWRELYPPYCFAAASETMADWESDLEFQYPSHEATMHFQHPPAKRGGLRMGREVSRPSGLSMLREAATTPVHLAEPSAPSSPGGSYVNSAARPPASQVSFRLSSPCI